MSLGCTLLLSAFSHSLGGLLTKGSQDAATRAGLDKIVNKMDYNGDGFISKDELEKYLNEVGGNVTLVEKLMGTLDVDGDGQLSKEEFMSLAY